MNRYSRRMQKSRLTLRQIADRAGTSKSSVSRVLSNHPNVAPATRARIERAIKKHGFQPNLFARGLAGGRTGLMATITVEMASGFYAEVLKGVDGVVSGRGGHVLSSFAHGPEDYVRLWQQFDRNRRVDGVILIAPPAELFATRLPANGLPVVLCSARPPAGAPGWRRADTVTVSNREAMQELLVALDGKGIRRAVYLAGPERVFDAEERRAAVESFVRSHPDWSMEFLQAGTTRELGHRVLDAHLAGHEPPEVVICFNDATAYGSIQALRDHGARSIVTGFDDETAAELMDMTTIHMPMPQLGEEAARLLLVRIDGKGPAREAMHEVLPVRPVLRTGFR